MSILDDELDVLENTDVTNPKLNEITYNFDKIHNVYIWEWNNQLYFKYNIPIMVGYGFKAYSTYKNNRYYIKLKMINYDNNYEAPCIWLLDNDSTKRSAVKKKIVKLFDLLAHNQYIVHLMIGNLMIGNYSRYMYNWVDIKYRKEVNPKIINYLKKHHPNKRMNIKDLQDFSDFINNEK